MTPSPLFFDSVHFSIFSDHASLFSLSVNVSAGVDVDVHCNKTAITETEDKTITSE